MVIASACAADLNGDGKYGLDDKLGFVVHDRTHINGFMNSTDVHTYLRNEQGEWEYVYGSEADYENITRLNQLFYHTDGSYYYGGTVAIESEQEGYNEIMNKFVSGDIFIMTAEMDDAVSLLREMKNDYGILPMPKADEDQENYYSGSRSTHNVFAMPVTTQNADNAGAFMEALSASNHETVLPAYYEIALKTKYSRDDESSRMYDIIHDGMMLNFSYLYNGAIGTSAAYETGLANPDNFMSYIEANRTSLEANFAKYVEEMEENCLSKKWVSAPAADTFFYRFSLGVQPNSRL
ncbi:MAG: hypothetical protein IJ493_02220 [Clostridia bacterium]|nr:hypothetical protein [Clostridia bacterium]